MVTGVKKEIEETEDHRVSLVPLACKVRLVIFPVLLVQLARKVTEGNVDYRYDR